MNRTVKIAWGSVAVGIVVLGVKTLAWRMTGSVALLSDALESIVNVATALAALLAVHIAAQPPDADHPFGHHKAEYISAVIEGVLIVVAAVLILNEAWQAWADPQPIEAAYTGLAINLAAGVLNALWCWVLLREGRRLRSPALEADGRHLLTDVFSSAGVAVGVGAAVLTGPHVTNFGESFDPLIALGGAERVEDATGLARVVDRLLDDPDRLVAMRSAARQFAAGRAAALDGVIDTLVAALGLEDAR